MIRPTAGIENQRVPRTSFAFVVNGSTVSFASPLVVKVLPFSSTLVTRWVTRVLSASGTRKVMTSPRRTVRGSTSRLMSRSPGFIIGVIEPVLMASSSPPEIRRTVMATKTMSASAITTVSNVPPIRDSSPCRRTERRPVVAAGAAATVPSAAAAVAVPPVTPAGTGSGRRWNRFIGVLVAQLRWSGVVVSGGCGAAIRAELSGSGVPRTGGNRWGEPEGRRRRPSGQGDRGDQLPALSPFVIAAPSSCVASTWKSKLTAPAWYLLSISGAFSGQLTEMS